MKKLIVLAVTALMLAGCSAQASSAPSASSSPSASVAAQDNSKSDAAAPASATATDTITAPKLTLAETCTKFIAAYTANPPIKGSKDNQAYWATMRDQLRPVHEGAAPEAKSFMDGLFAYYSLQADSWDPAQTPARTNAAAPYLADSYKVCGDYFPKR